MDAKAVEVGAQDSELKNSPVARETDEDSEGLRAVEPGEPVCFFNGQPYDHETVVKCGTELLRCDHGIWYPVGPADPDQL